MAYKIELLSKAKRDLKAIKYSGNKAAYTKVMALIEELKEHPTTGTGQPEQLKFNLAGYWSRHIDKKNRIIYRIEEEKILVVVVSAVGHY
ncbi:MAG: Txe/YoeB family addiction module toxin [Tangfeifania sp.]